MESEVATGTRVGGFRVVSLIGDGAMGRVYLADELQCRRRVALKLLVPELARDERFRRRFLRESRLAAQIDHPHVVPTFASGEEEGVLYLAMGYVEGSDLRELLRRDGKLEPGRTLDLLDQVADGLDAAHALGLVHRDVKPANILVAPAEGGERAYVCDFGLARHVSSVRSLTGELAMVGTIDYVPPEQIEGGPIDGRADVYSLACVLFECLAGARPFDRESELSVIFAHLNAPPPRLTDLRPELPEAFDSVFTTALAKSPQDRYATCRELVGAARAALRGQAIEPQKKRRRRLLVALAGLAAAAAVGGTIVAWGRGDRSDHLTTKPAVLSLQPNGLSLIDAKTHRVVGKRNFGSVIWDVAFAGGSAWLLLGDDQRIARVDLASHRVRNIFTLDHGGGIAAGGGSVWVTQHPDSSRPEVARIDVRTGKVSNRFRVGGGAGDGIAYAAGSLWLARGADIARVEPGSGHVLHRFPVGGSSIRVVFADGAVWAASRANGVITKIDPVANRITATVPLHGWISDLTVGGGFVWAAAVPDGVVFKLGEDELNVQGSPASGPNPERISFGGGGLWIANSVGKTISLFDPGARVRNKLAASTPPDLAQYHDGLVWVSAEPAPRPLAPIKGQELRISLPQEILGADPSTSFGGPGDPLNEQLFYATCANLLNYPDSAGPRGTQLRPELAAAMPTVSRDRRTYTFRIRSGLRFSPSSPNRPTDLRQPANAAPEVVTAETFRHTIENALSPKLGATAPAAPFASDIVGAGAYRAGKAPHIRGIVARGRSLSISLVRPAGDFLTRISMPYFCPVPLREPVVPSGLTGSIPSLGPYYSAGSADSRTVLLRNPNYAGLRPQRMARIVYTPDVPTPTAVAQVVRGEIDYLPTDLDSYSLLAPGGQLDRRYGPTSAASRHGEQRYFLQPQPGVDEILFNTRRPLFRDRRLRRAVNFALDRPALADIWGEPPADRYIPPAVPGYPRRHVYPVSNPDLRTARQLTRGRRRNAVLYFCGDPANRRVAEIVRSNLSRIGISISIVGSQGCLSGPDPKAARADLVLTRFDSLERDPAPFLRGVLADGVDDVQLGPGPWQDRSFRKRLEQVNELSGTARLAAYARLDAELVRAAPFAVYGTWVHPDYFSRKVGCKVFQSAYHVADLGAICVRKSG
jgi:ABC-type transport system substrate-binding protein/tRNA A-37 threonylcarbamoyl transferase component Bud32